MHQCSQALSCRAVLGAVCGPRAFLQSSGCPWHALCPSVPNSGYETRASRAQMGISASGWERTCECVNQTNPQCQEPPCLESWSQGFVICFMSFSAEVLPSFHFHLPAFQSVGGFFPAMINYSLSESKSAFSSLIICDEFILLTWAWTEAIEDNKLTLSIWMISLNYGWVKE